LEEKKLRNSVPNLFSKKKTSEFWSESILRNAKHSKIHSKPFFGTENTRKKTTFVSSFVKLHYFAEFRSVSFWFTEWSLLKYSESLQNEDFIPRNNENRSESIQRNFLERNFDGNPTHRRVWRQNILRLDFRMILWCNLHRTLRLLDFTGRFFNISTVIWYCGRGTVLYNQ
jgi:hypothetical protein